MNDPVPVKRHILVVDDDRLVLITLASGLREAGYEVSAASNGQDAFDSARSKHPDLALLDVRMAGMSGIELGRLLRERTGVPFLYLSAYGQADIVKSAAEHGALGYLVKPLDIPQILPSIEAALARAGEIRKLRDAEAQLNEALANSREISTAVGVLMERAHLDQKEAFEALRNHARAQRRKVQDVAKDVISGVETINRVLGVRSGQ
jgi:response regulator NasT